MYALIMAGGLGTRFWPKSRKKHPKQLLRIDNEKTLIQNTINRLQPLMPPEHIFIVSTKEQIDEIHRQLPEIPKTNLIIEPKGKNTAPCIGLSALFMQQLDPEEVMLVLPADHLITNNKEFINILRAGNKVAAEKENLVTIGIEPTFPATGYGYIQFNGEVESLDGVEVFKVKTFAEKPNLATAKRFVNSGDFLWNSGIFLWKIKTILSEIEEHLPHLYDGLMEIKKRLNSPKLNETINRVYCQIKSISIDYGVMEYAKNVTVLKGEFGWNDLGSWDEVYNICEKDKHKNVLIGRHLLKNSEGCFIDSPDKCVAVVGLNDLIVVNTDDALLICPREKAQEVKDIVEMAKRKKMDEYL